MNRRLVVVGVAVAAVAGAVVPSFASSQPLPISNPVTVSTQDGVGVGTSLPGQPLVGAHVYSDGHACVGFSYEIPVCTPVSTSVQTQQSAAVNPLPVGVYQNSSGTTVYAGQVGVSVGNNGEVCPLVSTQDWQCVGTNP